MPVNLDIPFVRTTPFSWFATRRSIHRQVERLTPLQTSGAMAKAVLEHVASRLPPPGTAAKPVVILVGEDPCSRASLMTNMAALAAATRDGRKPRLLLECKPQSLCTIEDACRAIRVDLARTAPLGAGRSAFVVDMLDMPPTHRAILYMLARDAGGTVDAFDADPGAIRAALAGAGGEPVVVVTGNVHLAPLHEALHDDTHMIAVTTIGPGYEEHTRTPHERKQQRYVHANADKILRLRAGKELADKPFDFDAYAGTLSLPRQQPRTVRFHVRRSRPSPG